MQEANNATTCREAPGRPEGFAGATESITGVDRRTTQRATRRAREVCQEARDIIRGTEADTGAFLDELAKLDTDSQPTRLLSASQEGGRTPVHVDGRPRQTRPRTARPPPRPDATGHLEFLLTGPSATRCRDWTTPAPTTTDRYAVTLSRAGAVSFSDT